MRYLPATARPATAGPGTRPRVELTIDEVVLRGVPRDQAEAVVAQLRATLAELAQRWSPENGAFPATRAESSRRLPAVIAPAGAPAVLGAALALGVWDDLTGASRPTRTKPAPTPRRGQGDGA